MERRYVISCVVGAWLLSLAAAAAAQTGSLRGSVKDEQGGVLPGATVTATGPAIIQPVTAVTDAAGYYRLINLPPGTYAVTAELAGFATFRRDGVLLRAGSNFQVDVQLRISALQETVTVSGESPMLEVTRPSNVLNISGEFQREMPLQARRNWSDFLELTPGVNARPFDDGSGRMVYFGHATEHFAHVIQLEGAIASNYNDAQVTYVGMNADMLDDIQVKTGGVDASSPMGTGLAINVLTKSGGNTFKGSAAYAYQPFEWNGNNVAAAGTGNVAGTPTTSKVNQFDGGLGGPLRRDRAWFFGSLRHASLESGISRTAREVANLNAFSPGGAFTTFNNTSKSWQPYVKVTSQLTGNHQLAVFYQRDRLRATGNREYHFDPVVVYSTGGSLYGGKVTSVWGQSLTSTLLVSYNDKGGSDLATYDNYVKSGPQIDYHENAFLSGGVMRGTGRLAEGGNIDSRSTSTASLMTLRADLTYYKSGWLGSHEFQTGFFGAPRSRYDAEEHFLNDGFIFEERRQIDPASPAAGTVPFHQQFVSPIDVKTRAARDRDLAFYVQDAWRPSARITASLGLRVDHVRRFDGLFGITRQSSRTIQPRLGFSYLVTADARNVLRGSYVREGEQMMGRDAITTFGSTNWYTTRDLYDVNGDGTFEREIVRPAITKSALAQDQFDPDLHQPYVDEYILGFRKQLAAQLAFDVSGIHRVYNDTYARYDINGIYPGGPNQPFGGFGLVDPDQGIVYRQTNNSWSRLNYSALELTVSKNMSHGFQALASINRQWQHISGTWNPTDPARFIDPAAFPNDKLIFQPRGNNEENSLTTGTALTYGPTWRKYSMRFGGTWQAPFGITAAGSLTVQAGPWSGALVDRLAADDPQIAIFGPGTVRSSTGVAQSNPLATRIRFVYPTRSEGQVQAPAITTLGLKVGKKVRLPASREVEVAANIFNLLNAGDFNQYTYSGANQIYNPNYLQLRSQQSARALQLTAIFRF